MFYTTKIDKEFLQGGFEILIDFIKDEILSNIPLETIHDKYINLKIGSSENKLSEEQFFLAYKSAELSVKDLNEFEKNKQSRQLFKRST